MTQMGKPGRRAITITSPEPTNYEALAAPPVALCQGYDNITGAGLSTAVTAKAESHGGTSGVNYTVCLGMKKLTEALQIDQSLSVGFGPFGSVDQKMKFVRQLNVTTYGISIVVYARHVMDTETIVDVALKEGIVPPSTDEEKRDFVRSYGDSYISSIAQGGEYYAVYTFYSETREEQQSLALEMKAKGIFDVVTVNAGLQVKLDNFVSETATRVAFSQNISGMRNPDLPESKDLITFALKFPKLELTAPTVVGFQSTGYEHVPKFGAFEPVVHNRNYFIGQGTDEGLAAKLVRIQQLLTQIGMIEQVYKFYGGFSDDKLARVRASAETDRDAINTQMVGFEADPVQHFTTPDLPSLKDGIPSLHYKVGESRTYGGKGGNPFRDVSPQTAILEQTRIVSVQMRSGGRVDRLDVTYENSHGKWSVAHGGGGGSLGALLILQPGQFIKTASGRSGTRLDRLKLELTDGRSVEGGGNGGVPFDWPPPTGSFIYGFSGRSGKEEDAIAFDYAGFEPASWT